MSRKQKALSRRQFIVITDKETGEQILYTCTSTAAKFLGRSRQWVSQVINNPLHVVHKKLEDMSLDEIYASCQGKVVVRQRGGYFKYDVQKIKSVVWRVHGTGDYSDGRSDDNITPIQTFLSLKSVAEFLGYTSELKSLKHEDILPKPVYNQLTGEGFLIQKIDLSELKDGDRLIGIRFSL